MSEEEKMEEREDEEIWVDVRTYATKEEAFDHALVALAMGEAVRVEHGEKPGEFDLQAVEESIPKITKELAEYEDEQVEKVEKGSISSDWRSFPAGVLHLIVWIGVLLLVFRAQMMDWRLVNAYASSSEGLIARGNWWRPFTALFLHADGLHLAGNVGTGAIFGMMVSKCVGPTRGWFLILLSGALGNLITSFVTYPQPFVSIGASTAVFGALGILSGVGVVENIREDLRMPWVGVFGPVIAGLILLGLWGGARVGSNTDVFGHVFGFLSGLGAGVICRYVIRDEIEALHRSEKKAM